mmetsp:Transcript_9198/g.32556  ORF Transcript_9198/g.32556 Transcript_9198/m.32556 type:complete len:265 (-) Transcript_9198:270-1064(-)
MAPPRVPTRELGVPLCAWLAGVAHDRGLGPGGRGRRRGVDVDGCARARTLGRRQERHRPARRIRVDDAATARACLGRRTVGAAPRRLWCPGPRAAGGPPRHGPAWSGPQRPPAPPRQTHRLRQRAHPVADADAARCWLWHAGRQTATAPSMRPRPRDLGGHVGRRRQRRVLGHDDGQSDGWLQLRRLPLGHGLGRHPPARYGHHSGLLLPDDADRTRCRRRRRAAGRGGAVAHGRTAKGGGGGPLERGARVIRRLMRPPRGPLF